MRRIVVDLSLEGTDRALRELYDFERKIKPKMEEICKRLAEVGVAEAQKHLVLANGNTDARIDEPIPIGNGYKISMSGKDVYFIEFGTGDAADAHGFTPLVAVYPGSYSEQNKRKYSQYGFWWYGGEQITETPAYMPMFYASQKIREELPRIAREVFGK